MTLVVLVALAAWLLASLANHVSGPWTPFLAPLNACALLPRLDFFAPDPIDVDYHLVVHDFLADGRSTAFQQVRFRHQGPLGIVWNPSKREHQAVMGAVSALALLQQSVAAAAQDGEALIQLSLPYLFLLHLAMQGPPLPNSGLRQFMVVETNGFGTDRRLALGILSNPHSAT